MFREWPHDLVSLNRKRLIRAYDDGNEGEIKEPEQEDIMLE